MTTSNPSYKLARPQLVAWLVLSMSLVLFCSVCFAGTAGARWFLFDSEVDLVVRLVVSRGRLDVRLPDGTTLGVTRSFTFDTNNITLETDSVSQGYLVFEDGYSREVVATVYLLQESTATLGQRVRPRFDWSSNPYLITLEAARGRFYVDLDYAFERGTRLDLIAAAGSVHLTAPGIYRAELAEQRVQLEARAGHGELRTATGAVTPVEAGSVGTLFGPETGTLEVPERATRLEPLPYVVLNAGFGAEEDIATNPALPIGWACTSQANLQHEPQGSVERTLFDRTAALHMLRAGQGLDHAESRCTYLFGLVPRTPADVSQYTSLALRARIQIHAHDVTTCGIQGSECPIMIELEYLAADTSPEAPLFWRHGFYAERPVSDTNPLACDTCLQDHERLNLNAWYLYDSGNLFRLLPENRRPVRITRLAVYASGHAYDAVVADLEIVAGLPAAR